jgi:hypothetical protein
MTKPPRPQRSTTKRRTEAILSLNLVSRFSRSDGRFDLPVVTGRTPRQVARRLA